MVNKDRCIIRLRDVGLIWPQIKVDNNNNCEPALLRSTKIYIILLLLLLFVSSVLSTELFGICSAAAVMS